MSVDQRNRRKKLSRDALEADRDRWRKLADELAVSLRTLIPPIRREYGDVDDLTALLAQYQAAAEETT